MGRAVARDYIAIAEQYAADVLDGRVPACKWVKAACQRQRDDLERDDLPFVFDETKASRVCLFIELLPRLKLDRPTGPLALDVRQ